MHVCMYVCMHACMHTYIHACIHTYMSNTYIHMHTYIYVQFLPKSMQGGNLYPHFYDVLWSTV